MRALLARIAGAFWRAVGLPQLGENTEAPYDSDEQIDMVGEGKLNGLADGPPLDDCAADNGCDGCSGRCTR